MTDDKKVVKLTKVANNQNADNAYPTYVELVNGHLEKLDDYRKSIKPIVMIITCLTDNGNMQEVIYGECVAQVLGLLEITKQNIYLDSIGVLE
jgi:hypothetical protein